jgi:hypothetical protein
VEIETTATVVEERFFVSKMEDVDFYSSLFCKRHTRKLH